METLQEQYNALNKEREDIEGKIKELNGLLEDVSMAKYHDTSKQPNNGSTANVHGNNLPLPAESESEIA